MAPVKGQGAAHVVRRWVARVDNAVARLDRDAEVGPVPILTVVEGMADQPVEFDRLVGDRILHHPGDQIAPVTRGKGQLVIAAAQTALGAESDGPVDRCGQVKVGLCTNIPVAAWADPVRFEGDSRVQRAVVQIRLVGAGADYADREPGTWYPTGDLRSGAKLGKHYHAPRFLGIIQPCR